jgi:DNA-binding transcriptional LysR family regulator
VSAAGFNTSRAHALPAARATRSLTFTVIERSNALRIIRRSIRLGSHVPCGVSSLRSTSQLIVPIALCVARYRSNCHSSGSVSMIAAIEAALAGQGIALCSDVLVARELVDGLLMRLSKFSLPGYGFFLVYSPDRTTDRRVIAFTEWIKQVAQHARGGAAATGSANHAAFRQP